MQLRHTFHLLGETLTFMSRHEMSTSWADWIELDSHQVLSVLTRESSVLGAAWAALEAHHGFQLGPPSEGQIIERLYKSLLDHSAHLVVARSATAADGPRCGIGRVKNKHAPKETVEVDGINRPGSPKKIVLEKNTESAYVALTAAARKAGLQEPLFLIVSGYRDTARQKELFTKALAKYHSFAEARKWVAPPGHSAHATGCAIDFWFGFPCGKEFNDRIKSSDAYKWMVANANTHGFNPYGREGWHWEYNVGEPY
jgi:D-alanyl-D-alanine carboxypeptidase-like protein